MQLYNLQHAFLYYVKLAMYGLNIPHIIISNLILCSRIIWRTAYYLSRNLSPIENSIGNGETQTLDLPSTSLTRYQLSCPDWIRPEYVVGLAIIFHLISSNKFLATRFYNWMFWCEILNVWKKGCSGREILYKWKAQLDLKNWKNLFGDQREDSLTSLEVSYLL